MNRLVFRMPLVCLVGAGLVACSAAGEAPTPRGSGTMPAAAGGDISAGTPLQLGPTSPEATGLPTTGDDGGTRSGDDDDGALAPTCECDALPPGVSVDVGDGGITVVVELPGSEPLTITTPSGRCAPSLDGVSIAGDVSIEIGAGEPIVLADAAIDVSVAEGTPLVRGSAHLSGAVLDGIGCGCSEAAIPVDVSLAASAAIGAGADIELELALPSDDVSIDTAALPLGGKVVTIADADLKWLTNGDHGRLEVAGSVAADAALWSDELPLVAEAEVDVLATFDAQALVSLELTADLELEGGELTSGVTPLRSLTMPRAWLTLDSTGAKLHATASASAHPLFSIEGRALVDAHFTPGTWSLKVCADVMTDIASASVRLGQCLDSGPDGSVICDCPRDNEGYCHGEGDPAEH